MAHGGVVRGVVGLRRGRAPERLLGAGQEQRPEEELLEGPVLVAHADGEPAAIDHGGGAERAPLTDLDGGLRGPGGTPLGAQVSSRILA